MGELNHFSELLNDFGLHEDEIAVCMALRQCRTLSAAEVARKIDASRPYVYDMLAHLERRGFLNVFTHKNVRRFEFTSFRELLLLVDKEERSLLRIKDKLLALSEDEGQVLQELPRWPISA